MFIGYEYEGTDSGRGQFIIGGQQNFDTHYETTGGAFSVISSAGLAIMLLGLSFF